MHCLYIVANPFEQKIDQPLLRISLNRSRLDPGCHHNGLSLSNRLPKINPSETLQENPDNRSRMAAQGEGIFRTGWNDPDMEKRREADPDDPRQTGLAA